jgi:hypothetical protein
MMGGGEKLFNLRQRLMRAPAGFGSGLWTRRENRFATDSPLEGTGFEPSVPRERLVLSFSFTPTFPLARVNRPDPIPKAYITRGPMVRIRSPPAGSQ